MALRATEGDEDELEGGQSWPQPPFRRRRLKAVPRGDPRAGLPALQLASLRLQTERFPRV